MFAEMLGMVCHKEYLDYGNQTVTAAPNHTNGQAFVVHLSGLKACFYWAEFTSDYLRAVRFSSLRDLKDFGTVKLCHTRALSLVDPDERVQFLEQFISVLRCIAAGDANVGYLPRDCKTPIHREIPFPDNASDHDDGNHAEEWQN